MADGPQEIEARVALWLDQHQRLVDRWKTMLVELRSATGTDYAMYAVANRELMEEAGTTTWESMRNAAEIARQQHIGAVVLVSDPFHMLRSLKMARDLRLDAYGSPTRTSPISGNAVSWL